MKTSLTQLLVHLDATPQAARRLAVARQIAQAHGSAITALYAATPSLLDMPFVSESGPSVGAILRKLDDEQRARARDAFGQSLAAPGIRAIWAEVRGEPMMAAFAQQALFADLLVLGQYSPDDVQPSGVPPDFAEALMASSGKPALIIPYAGVPAANYGTVVIAWKPTREAARAVSAAMPMLQAARQVHVVSWSGAPSTVQVDGDRLTLDGCLKQRGVKAVWHRQDDEPDSFGELLLLQAFYLQADLLVMGCYSHSRAREWVLGGASRTVLRSMTLPVLMSH
jgi:nucleotide-binding universal stress UspA family protein